MAFGCLPPRLITIASDVIAERTEANRAAAASSTAPAQTRGQLPHAQRAGMDGRGIHHGRCDVYQLRSKRKELDQKTKKARRDQRLARGAVRPRRGDRHSPRRDGHPRAGRHP